MQPVRETRTAIVVTQRKLEGMFGTFSMIDGNKFRTYARNAPVPSHILYDCRGHMTIWTLDNLS